MCDNYRPISLLSLAYKVFASMLLRRLKDGGTDALIWPTQFVFKSGAGTADALFVVRRLLDKTWAAKSEQKLFLALDWAKAFDSISPSSLLKALARFGLPPGYVDMIGAIYSSRKFFVHECGSTSGVHAQHFGISVLIRDIDDGANAGCAGEAARGTRHTARPCGGQRAAVRR